MLDLQHCRLGDRLPDIVAEEEDAVAVRGGFGDVEVAAQEGDEEGVEDVVKEFMEELLALASVGLRTFCCGDVV